MRLFFIVLSVLTVFLNTQNTSAQNTPTRGEWNAKWIAAPNDEGRDYGVYYFRKNIELAAKPASFYIHVSADNRYKLYINSKLVSQGPARGDLHYWNYETIDLAPYLTAGKNIIAAQVWNEAQHRPEAQVSLRTGFILQGNTSAEEIINTGNSWKVLKDAGYGPIPGYFFAASTGEMVDMNRSVVQGWTTSGFDDTAWPNAANTFDPKLKGQWDGFVWMLVPSPLPQMELKYERIPKLRKATGIKAPATFPGTKATLVIPAKTTVKLLLDQTYLTNAYVTLNFSKGKNAGISLKYAESMYADPKSGRKGNRDVIEGKQFVGRKDSIISNGNAGQSYTNLNFRTFRYVELIVSTKSEPLVIDDLYGTFTGYPFKVNAVYNSADAEAKKILDIGWRTARLNAFETYTDCPYYEQLQYIGDTRIQAMVSYYYAGDDRLARNAINLMDHSRLAEGVTYSRYPTKGTQVISTFSLWYIGMLHDYWMYRGDEAFLQDKLAGTRSILNFFQKYQQPNGSLKNTPYWTFVDWVGGKNWNMGGPKDDHGSSILDLQLLWAYQWAAQLEAKMGMQAYADIYNKKAAQLQQTVRQRYWSTEKMMYADSEEKNTFSQHANSLAILTGMVNEADMPALGKKMLTDSTLTQCTIYFKYYLHQALVKAGLGNDYMNWLDIWRENIRYGLTTWTEDSNVEHTRSDCHAWGSSPNIEFFRTILGIDSDAPGFSKIRIEPHLGSLTKISGEILHPNGKVAASYLLDKGKWKIKISLPQNTSGKLVWKGNEHVLKAGDNSFSI
ncbi:alpha-rhamnosidase [Mucilaginibacter hurinus]|uniref:Alpha-rhamnosidase n=1 Tax=Mucilaginibacter hurinus TaxID=2201324 RepID=A0A367GL51_9SPHI|nr:alpha-L-rhamnosidase C-terminal domain-containing protein [Mucilaginibacter hurinus]RCH53688.1 alpha-rhamnosidase [Mucilaginibacter hurinus]